jgi:hypothetical protein
MSLPYAVIFLILALAGVAAGAFAAPTQGWAAFLFHYLAFSFALLAVAYAGVGPRMLLKRSDGRQSPPGWILFGPYFLLNGVLLALQRNLTREPAHVEVVPGLHFGRRLTAREAADTAWPSVLDLAAEFAEVLPFRQKPGYLSLPVLDATAPTPEELGDAVAWIRQALATGPVYVHCALGHGRSACVVVGYLLDSGAVASVGAGVRLLRSLRPGVRLNASQRQVLQTLQPRARG